MTQTTTPTASFAMLDYDILYFRREQQWYADIFNPEDGASVCLSPYFETEEEAFAFADQWIADSGAAIPIASQARLICTETIPD